jgi:hypothetical protein
VRETLAYARERRAIMRHSYRTMPTTSRIDRRGFVRAATVGAAAVGGLVLGIPAPGEETPATTETNVDDFLRVPRTRLSLPGLFPGRVVKVTDARVLRDERVDGRVAAEMVEKGIRALTGKGMKDAFRLLFTPDDVIGIKVNPVGPPLIHTKPETVEAVVAWFVENGVPKKSIVIWDRFEHMLKEAGYTPERFPGIRVEGLQTMDESEGGTIWRAADGSHVSAANFDQDVFYLARGVVGRNVPGYADDAFYHNQHVFTGEKSFFGKLLTQRLTKIVNVAAFKNTGNGVSMATKNMGYGAICNTGRLHKPLFFNVCTEVLAAPVVRDKMVLSMIDGIRGQYEGGPDKNERFVYPNASLYFATDPFALDMTGHREVVAKRKAMGVTTNEHPRFTEYLHYAERLGLGVATPEKIDLVEVRA